MAMGRPRASTMAWIAGMVRTDPCSIGLLVPVDEDARDYVVDELEPLFAVDRRRTLARLTFDEVEAPIWFDSGRGSEPCRGLTFRNLFRADLSLRARPKTMAAW